MNLVERLIKKRSTYSVVQRLRFSDFVPRVGGGGCLAFSWFRLGYLYVFRLGT